MHSAISKTGKTAPISTDGMPASKQEGSSTKAPGATATDAPKNPPRAAEEQTNNGLSTIIDYLTSVPAWYLATCEGDQPHVRPFSFAAQQNGRIWFCTATTKDVYRELQKNPKFELTAWKPGHGWIILRGEADLRDEANAEVRRAGFEHMCSLGEYHESENDPTLTFFSITGPQAWLCDIDGTWTPIPLPSIS